MKVLRTTTPAVAPAERPYGAIRPEELRLQTQYPFPPWHTPQTGPSPGYPSVESKSLCVSPTMSRAIHNRTGWWPKPPWRCAKVSGGCCRTTAILIPTTPPQSAAVPKTKMVGSATLPASHARCQTACDDGTERQACLTSIPTHVATKTDDNTAVWKYGTAGAVMGHSAAMPYR